MFGRIKEEVIDVDQQENDAGNSAKANIDNEITELEHLRKLFIGGLPPITTEKSLKNYYEQWGKIVDVVVMRENITKRSRGFGFVTYLKSYMVDKAQNNRPHVVDGKRVEAKRALPRPDRDSRESNTSVKKLFVGGLKDNHDVECIKKYFSQFGQVIDVKILADKMSGKRRGFAFIEFDDYDAVDKAILQTHHSLKYVTLDVKKAVYNKDTARPKIQNGIVNKMPMEGNNYYNQQQPQQPVNSVPPVNYNNWGPPVNYGYNQPPQNWNNWYYPQNTWNYPPQQPAWNQGWGGPMPNGPPPPMVQQYPPSDAGNWNYQQPNFGAGYQQSYGGGPTKHIDINSNRMMPYNGQTSNNSMNSYQNSYNGYNNGQFPSSSGRY